MDVLQIYKCVDFYVTNAYTVTMSSTYSTAQVATAIDVNKSTLLRWLYTKKLAEPRMETFAGMSIRIWTEEDLATAKMFREENYRQRPSNK